MQMMLQNIFTRAQFTKDSQFFHIIISLERDSGGVQHCIAELEKGAEAESTARKLEDLAKQVREA